MSCSASAGLAHDRGIGDANAVVAEGDSAVRVHGADLGKLLALATLGDGADGQNVG
jgi:hypothetical protein